MRDLSDNKFLADYQRSGDELTLNSFLFSYRTEQKSVGIYKLYESVFELLAALGFNFHYSGYKYLAGLVTMYFVRNDYDEHNAVTELSVRYDVSEDYVFANIADVCEMNEKFILLSSYLLNKRLTAQDCGDISTVVEIIGAIFKLYYNFVVSDDESSRNTRGHEPKRLDENAKQ